VTSTDFFPVNLASDIEFALVFALLSLVTVLIAKQVQQIALGLLDPPVEAAPSVRATQAAVDLGEGRLPRSDQLDAVALLRGGEPGLAELIRKRAFSEGWLSGEGDVLTVGPAAPRESPLSTSLRAALPFARASELELARASRRIAVKRAAELEPLLVSRGLLRSPLAQAVGLLAFGAPAALLFFLGLLRADRALNLGHSAAPAVLELVVCGLAFLALAKPEPRTETGARYVTWLRGATEALAEDIAAGIAPNRDDLLLVIAARGAPDKSNRPLTSSSLSITTEQGEGGGGGGG